MCYAHAVREISQRELRNQSGDVLRRVAAGESFVVTNNGTPAALLTPVRESEGWDAMILRGQMRPPVRAVDIAELSESSLPARQGLSAVEALRDDRGDR